MVASALFTFGEAQVGDGNTSVLFHHVSLFDCVFSMMGDNQGAEDQTCVLFVRSCLFGFIRVFSVRFRVEEDQTGASFVSNGSYAGGGSDDTLRNPDFDLEYSTPGLAPFLVVGVKEIFFVRIKFFSSSFSLLIVR
jgi:hypothetical protein